MVQMRLVTSWARELAIQDHIYVIDCVYEFFVLVGSEVRGNRLDIRLALSVASVGVLRSLTDPLPT